MNALHPLLLTAPTGSTPQHIYSFHQQLMHRNSDLAMRLKKTEIPVASVASTGQEEEKPHGESGQGSGAEQPVNGKSLESSANKEGGDPNSSAVSRTSSVRRPVGLSVKLFHPAPPFHFSLGGHPHKHFGRTGAAECSGGRGGCLQEGRAAASQGEGEGRRRRLVIRSVLSLCTLREKSMESQK